MHSADAHALSVITDCLAQLSSDSAPSAPHSDLRALLSAVSAPAPPAPLGALTALSLHVEDLIHAHPSALSRAPLRSACADLRTRVDSYALFARACAASSDRLLTCRLCRARLSQLDRCLRALERAIGAANKDAL